MFIVAKWECHSKIKSRMANNIDPDKTARDEPSHLDLYCLQIYTVLVCRGKGEHIL